MIFDDNTIDFKNELKKSNNELSNLKQKYQELEADREYIKSLLNVSHEHNYKLKKENEQLKHNNKIVSNEIVNSMVKYGFMVQPTSNLTSVVKLLKPNQTHRIDINTTNNKELDKESDTYGKNERISHRITWKL